jgi:hypothetical protein
MNLSHIPEPQIEFAYQQPLEDPRDGLTLFGPLDSAPRYGIRAGVISTAAGIERFTRWAQTVRGPVGLDAETRARPPFPGFEAAFRVSADLGGVAQLTVDEQPLHDALRDADRHQRVFRTVSLYADALIAFGRIEESPVDVWLVVIPDDVYRYCRPRSNVPTAEKVVSSPRVSASFGKRLARTPSLFEELNRDAVPYQHQPDFRNQLKGRLLPHRIATQIVRESTIAHRDFLTATGRPVRDLDVMQSAIAWNLCTTGYYKCGGRPWKLAAVREGVCYLGMVFKVDERTDHRNYSCCAAQMFLDSGDGIVFRGALGPWRSPDTREFHLDFSAAKDLMATAIGAYAGRCGTPPLEVFVHGSTRLSNDEWAGFCAGAGTATRLVGVQVRSGGLRLYHQGAYTCLRGLACVVDDRRAVLWTKGFVPRLQTYPGREIPVPLQIDITRGEADIGTVLTDIISLTKLNYNSCIFADGWPVTLRFANAVGEILTAAPLSGVPPLPFKYYI